MSAPTVDQLAVFIPYFQRTAGLLRVALQSIADQDLEGEIQVIVVNDGSPVPVAPEIEGFEGRLRIHVIDQENGGVSAARNTALRYIEDHWEDPVVAIIDSDDIWSTSHISRGLQAIGSGADLYMSNWMPLEFESDAYHAMDKLKLSEHRPHDSLENAYWFQKDHFIQEFRKSIGRPSSLVMRWRLFWGIRNPIHIKSGSEDLVWRSTLFARQPKVVFSTVPEVSSGEGVNVFSAASWGTPQGLRRFACRSRALRDVRRLKSVREERERLTVIREELTHSRADAASNALHLLRRRKKGIVGAVVEALRMDPMLGPMFPWLALRTAYQSRKSSKGEN